MNSISTRDPFIQPASESLLFGCGFSINVESFLSLISKIAEFFAWLFGFSSNATMADLQEKKVEVLHSGQLPTTSLESVVAVTCHVQKPVIEAPISKEEQEIIQNLQEEIENCKGTDNLRGLAYLKVALGINKNYNRLISIARSHIKELTPGAIEEAQRIMLDAQILIAKEALSSHEVENAGKILNDLELYRSHVFVKGLKECLANLEAKLEAVEAKKQEAIKTEETEIVLQNAQEFMSNPMKLDFGVLRITIDIVNSLEMAEKNALGNLKEKIAAAKNALLEQLDKEYKECATARSDQAWEEKESKYILLKEFNALMKSHEKHHLKYIM
jgi:hypothetical protein